MSITEEQRHRLIRALERELGEEEAASLMELVPRVHWEDLATKRDVLAVASDVHGVKSDVHGVKSDVHGVKSDVHAVKSDVHAVASRLDVLESRVGSLESRMDERFDQQDRLWRAELGRVEAHVDASIADAVNRLTFRLLPAMATMIAIFGAIAALF